MRVPATIEITLPDPEKPKPLTHPLVVICPNDGTMVYKAWSDLYLEAANHNPHTCKVSQEFIKKTGQKEAL